MLKQILTNMYVILAELSEEQKQILFFKMRQEQVRRWNEREAVATTPKPVLKKDHGKSVQWKLGADGDIWVWVMGEHMLDKPYDLLGSEILAERVKQQSLQQIETIRTTPMEKVTESLVSPFPQFLSESGFEILRDNNIFVQRDVPKRVENTPAVGNHRNLECIQSSKSSISSSPRDSIGRWFKEEQINFRAGFEKSMDQIALWFHGILTTKKAEELLEGLAPGSFLIRVSEKIKGYVLSYLSAKDCNHFLIDASGDSYS